MRGIIDTERDFSSASGRRDSMRTAAISQLAVRMNVPGERNAAASMAIASGADVKLVQQMLGHADATETLNTYSHLWPDRIDEISTKLEAARNAARAVQAPANVPEMSPIAKMTA